MSFFTSRMTGGVGPILAALEGPGAGDQRGDQPRPEAERLGAVLGRRGPKGRR